MITFRQYNCTEGSKIDVRQAKAVIRQKPDAIIFEYPCDKNIPRTSREITELQKRLRRDAKRRPWIASDISTWENIKKLDKNVEFIFADAPKAVVNKLVGIRRGAADGDLFWWVRIYLREMHMTRAIRKFLRKHHNKNLKVLVFLQSFHWKHVKFLLTNPPKKKIWHYYFSRFPEITPRILATKLKHLQ